MQIFGDPEAMRFWDCAPSRNLAETMARIPKNTLPPKPAIEGEARVEVLRPARDARAGWSGRVIDAHDAFPIHGARVRVERPGFERATVVASVFVNEAGRFELRAEGDGFDELVVDGPLHAELRQPLPQCGELQIALVLRKRKLLERLVGWAKRRGRPYDIQPEPTPGHVRRAAGNDFATAKWADAVEKAAYGGGDVDARLEAEVDRLAPVGAPAAKDPGLTVRDVPPEAPDLDFPPSGDANDVGRTVPGLAPPAPAKRAVRDGRDGSATLPLRPGGHRPGFDSGASRRPMGPPSSKSPVYTRGISPRSGVGRYG
jgi:hypothetical protein